MKGLLIFWQYLRPYRWNLAGFFAFTLISTLFSVVSLGMVIPFLQILFDQVQAPATAPVFNWTLDSGIQWLYYQAGAIFGQSSKSSLLGFICLGVIVLFLIKNLFTYLSLHMLAPLRSGVIRDLRQQVFSHLTRLPLSYFSEQKKGDIMSRISSDVVEIEWSILNSFVSLMRDPITILAFLATMFAFNAKLTLLALVLIPASGFLIGKIGRSLKATSRENQQLLSAMNVVVEETLGGMRVVKAFRAEPQVRSKFTRINNSMFRLGKGIFRRQSLSSPLSEFLGSIVIAAVMWTGGQIVLGEGLEASAFIAYIAMFSQVIAPAKAVSTTWYNMQKGLSGLSRIQEILEADNPIQDPEKPAALKPFTQSIKFQNVTFGYTEDRHVLKDVSLEIPAGSTVALVGRSGAGKSTLMDLIPRFYEIESGSIKIDGVDIREMRLMDLCGLMAMVPQNPILFNDSIAANIAFGSGKPDMDKVKWAANQAYANEFIEAWPQGYETLIGDLGSKLSGGQKQRIAIARAIYKNPSILLLDEATSALDAENEKWVQEAIQNLMKGRTSIIIAHRLQTIRHADLIVVMENGNIAETGTHESLMNSGGLYAKLYNDGLSE